MNKIQNLTKSFICSEVSSALISSSHNILYFTGFNTSDGYLFVTKDVSYLLVDFRYIEAARDSVKDCEVVLLQNLKDDLSGLIKKHGIKNTCFESDYISLTKADLLKDLFESNDVKLNFSRDLDDCINKIRMIKGSDEVKKIRTSQEIAERAFDSILDFIKPGITEKEIALELEFNMRKFGAEKVSFDLIVVSGENTSLPHGVPTDRCVEKGDFITIDMGAVYKGYCSDMTRTIAVSDVDDEKKKVYDIVLEAQCAAINAVRPGVVCSEIDRIARDIIYDSGYKGFFGHSTGHSLGVQIHESPSFSSRDKTVVKEGMVMTVEPGIYIPKKFGVRIEDMVLVTSTGCENLTSVTKDLIKLNF